MNVKDIGSCFGCGVCTIACSRKIIEIHLNQDGFYQPRIIEPKKCSDCGLCVKVCSYVHDDYSLKMKRIEAYGSWSKEYAVRRNCSSGGVGFEVGRYLIGLGYKVAGCRYNIKLGRAEHYIASTVEELIPSIGSKYLQSYTPDAFSQINRKQQYLVIGTPCQIDSFRRYIQQFHCEENFVLMDFFCHSVPSMLAWEKYVNIQEKKVGKLTYVSWRNKQTGWHDSYAIGIDGEKKGDSVNRNDDYNLSIMKKETFIYSRLSQGDIFYKLFLGGYCNNPACKQKCRFKYDKSSADIRIGDAWGELYSNNEDGVSASIAFTEKGDEILHSCNLVLEKYCFEKIAEGQMKTNTKSATLSTIAMRMLKKNKDYSEGDWHRLFFLEGLFHIPYRLKCKLCNLWKLLK